MNAGASWTRIPYLAISWLFVAGVLLQAFLAGMSLLGGQPAWGAHVGLGHSLLLLGLLLLALAYIGRFQRSVKNQTWILLGIYILVAMVFAIIRGAAPMVAALHPVLAFVLFWQSVVVAQQARSLAREPEPVIAPNLTAGEAIGD